jgi:very-short-patch-repair endonuclease
MPLAEVADNIPARPGVFDVVIVDEASQVPVLSLFLLWLAPRIVVVGDEEQCTPGLNTATDLGAAYEILDRNLPELDTAERHNLGPNSNLYQLMSARASETIRLREHFRSMPEIIGWSSTKFYDQRLVPLRQFGADRLDPLKVIQVPDAEEKFRDSALRNEAEALMIAEQVEHLIVDPRNGERTIGVVVLQDCYQTKLIDIELRKRINGRDYERFKLRVGTPPDFQGEERDIILLSLVATRKRTTIRGKPAERRFNVAASRARDQMWLFTSMDMNTLDPTDLRYSLFQHMRHPPDDNAPDPTLDLTTPDDRREPFESVHQQRILLELRARGFVVLPQYEVDAKRVDFLVIGEHGRLAVECDGPSVPRTPEEVAEDIIRERELRRSAWRIVRIRESQFILDPDRALQPLWAELHKRGIEPRATVKES